MADDSGQFYGNPDDVAMAVGMIEDPTQRQQALEQFQKQMRENGGSLPQTADVPGGLQTSQIIPQAGASSGSGGKNDPIAKTLADPMVQYLASVTKAQTDRNLQKIGAVQALETINNATTQK
jgi:hypothetical protein